MKSTYHLKRFHNSWDPDFAAAMLLYARNTAAAVRTDTNEIAYWTDHFEKRFGDPFYVFGFYRNRDLVGYAEAAYLRGTRIFALDYVVLDASHRRNNVFYEFIAHLQEFLERQHPEYQYAVVEVGFGPGLKHPSRESSLLVRLLKLQGFHIVHAPYVQPRLRSNDAESEMIGHLMVYMPGEVEALHTDTYLRIVKALYYDYYLRWKTVVPAGQSAYAQHLDRLYETVRAGVRGRRTILVNGHRTLLAGSTPRQAMTVHKIVLFVGQAASVVLLLTVALLGIRAAFGLSNATFAAIYGLAIVSFLGLAGIVSRDARSIFTELLHMAERLLRRQGSVAEYDSSGGSLPRKKPEQPGPDQIPPDASV